GRSWARAGEGALPEAPALALAVLPGSPENVYALLDGTLWVSADGARSWRTRTSGLPAGRVEALAQDLKKATRLWAVASARVFMSDDAGANWTAYGNALPDPGISVRGLAVS